MKTLETLIIFDHIYTSPRITFDVLGILELADSFLSGTIPAELFELTALGKTARFSSPVYIFTASSLTSSFL
jgi:hypothetical protein